MVATSPSKRWSSSRSSSYQLWKEKRKRAACLIAAIGSVAVTAAHASQFVEKRQIHTSVLTGQRWLDELLTGGWYWASLVLQV
jgi:hypothetical protein